MSARSRKNSPNSRETAVPPPTPSPLIHTILPAVVLCITVLFLTIRPLSDPDTWFHLAFGKWFSQHHSVPRADPFASSSSGREWISSGWLSSVLMYHLYLWGGVGGMGLILMVTAIVGAAYGLVLFAAQRWFGDRSFMVLPLLLGLGLACVRFSPRPDVFSQLMIALLLLILVLTDVRKPSGYPPWYFYLIYPVFLIWANLHAGFVIGALILLVYAASTLTGSTGMEQPWRFFRAQQCLFCIAFANINPYAQKIWVLPFRISRIPKVSWIMEWMPLLKRGFPMPPGAYVCGALLITFVSYALWRSRARWWQCAVAALLIGMALLQRRQVGPAAIGLCVLLLPSLPALGANFRRSAAVPIASAVLAFSLCAAKVAGQLGGGSGAPRQGIDCTGLPCVATDFLQNHRPPEKLFNSYAFGGYLLYHLGPETKVYIDGRLDVYDPQVYLDALAVEENRLSIEQMEKRYSLRTWVLSIEDAIGDPEHLASRLALRPDYALVHFDDQAAVFVKRTIETTSYIAQQEFRTVNPWKLEPSQPDNVQSDDTVAEVQRAIDQSMGSANADAIAALYAARAGDEQTAREMLQKSDMRAPGNPLARQVAAKLRLH